ncbi:MAG: galactokinase family protein [Pseudomonadota bacterium]
MNFLPKCRGFSPNTPTSSVKLARPSFQYGCCLFSTPLQQCAPEEALENLRSKFGTHAGARVAFAPYRVCPLGAHVDHQFGEVMAGALDVGITIAFAPRTDRVVNVYSVMLDDTCHCSWDDLSQTTHWSRFLVGAMWSLTQKGRAADWVGMDAVVLGAGMASGLSSSAAIGIAYLLALADCNNVVLEQQQLIDLDACIEQEFMGLNNGTLDPGAIALSKADHITHIQTRTNAFQHYAAGGQFNLLAVYSGLSKALTPDNFNQRVQQSWDAAAAIGRHCGRILESPRLGDYSPLEYAAAKTTLEPTQQLRAEHFFTETERVRKGLDAWRQGDVSRLGALLTASAESSMQNYECGATPVRDLVRSLQTAPGVAGARFCGPGFRGCCIALLDGSVASADVVAQAQEQYAKKHPTLSDQVWATECVISDRAGVLA